MSVYIGPTSQLWGDDQEELNAFALSIGLDPRYRMTNGKYWVNDSHASLALRGGALYIDSGPANEICPSCGSNCTIKWYLSNKKWIVSNKSKRSVCFKCRIDYAQSERLRDITSKLVHCPRCDRDRYAFPASRGYCDKCAVERDSLFRHNLTVGQAEDMLASQENRCAICRTEIDLSTANVDHDHGHCNGRSCGECARGLLCMRCNVGLGFFSDNIENLRNAAIYIEKAQQK